jgi:hypothetical protein
VGIFIYIYVGIYIYIVGIAIAPSHSLCAVDLFSLLEASSFARKLFFFGGKEKKSSKKGRKGHGRRVTVGPARQGIPSWPGPDSSCSLSGSTTRARASNCRAESRLKPSSTRGPSESVWMTASFSRCKSGEWLTSLLGVREFDR